MVLEVVDKNKMDNSQMTEAIQAVLLQIAELRQQKVEEAEKRHNEKRRQGR